MPNENPDPKDDEFGGEKRWEDPKEPKTPLDAEPKGDLEIPEQPLTDEELEKIGQQIAEGGPF